MSKVRITTSQARFIKKLELTKSEHQEDLKAIDLVFENCESFTIPISKVKFLEISGLRENLELANQYGNQITAFGAGDEIGYPTTLHSDTASWVVIGLDSDFLKKSITNEGLSWQEDPDNPQSVYNRIKEVKDITGLMLLYQNGFQRDIFVPWKPEQGTFSKNSYLRFGDRAGLLSRDGNLLELIFTKKNLKK